MLDFNAKFAKFFLQLTVFKFAKAFDFIESSISLSKEHEHFKL